MKHEVTGPLAVGAAVVVLLAIAIAGAHYLSGGKKGEKPKLDPRIDRMYSRPQTGGANPGSQGR